MRDRLFVGVGEDERDVQQERLEPDQDEGGAVLDPGGHRRSRHPIPRRYERERESGKTTISHCAMDGLTLRARRV